MQTWEQNIQIEIDSVSVDVIKKDTLVTVKDGVNHVENVKDMFMELRGLTMTKKPKYIDIGYEDTMERYSNEYDF